ncbi:MAG: hypothetical protein LC119_01860 [Burkholderiales bacterium]|nr:hypothetical protein [Rubrivivax sp.]MCZ2438903.1 hypothetical protein [Burkholderiales bacterium]
MTGLRRPAGGAGTAHKAIRRDGGRQALLGLMQTRDKLCERIGDHDCER